MKTNNKLILAMIVAMNINFNTVQSAELVGSGFSYQGELLDNGSPANTLYDIKFIAYDALVDGNSVGMAVEFLNVEVINGLFNIENVDFGDIAYEGKEVFIEVSVRKSIDAGTYSALDPRQRIGATPYSVQSEFSKQADTATTATTSTSANVADTLAAGTAGSGDILQFGATGWGPVPLSNLNQSPWTLANNNNITYSDGNVGIGTNNPAAPITVKATTAEIARFSGGSDLTHTYYENNLFRGYVGSVQDGSNSGTSSDDFEIGTPLTSTAKMHITTKQYPRITVDEVGRVGIGEINPAARLEVDGNVLMNPLTVKVEGITKLKVNVDGRVDITEHLTVNKNLQVDQKIDVNGKLTAHADMQVNGNTQQPLASNGMLKFMVVANCDTFNKSASIVRSYNGTTTAGSVSATYVAGGHSCKLNFPVNINNRFWVTTSNYGIGGTSVSCSATANNQLHCQMGFIDSGVVTAISGDFTLLVY